MDLDPNLDPLLSGERTKDVAHLTHERGQLDRLRAEVHLAGLDLREIQHVVDELQEVASAGEDVAQVFLVLRRHRPYLAVVHELGEPDNPVQRCPKLVGHVGEKLALESARLLEAPVLLLPHLFEPSAVRDVADRAGDQHAVLGFQRAQADLHRNLRAVLAESMELQPGTHRPYARIREEPGPVATVRRPVPLGHEDLYRIAQQVHALVTEEPLGLRVHQHDPPLAIDDHDGVRGRLQQSTELLLRALALADVADRAHREHPLLRLQGAQAYLHRELRSVTPPTVEIKSGAHRPHARVREVSRAVTDMRPAEPLRHQQLDRLTEQLFSRVPEQPFGLGVHQNDPAEFVHDDDRVRDRFEEPAKPRLRAGGLVQDPLRGHVSLADDDEVDVALRVANGPFGDVDKDEATLLRAAHGLKGRGARLEGGR